MSDEKPAETQSGNLAEDKISRDANFDPETVVLQGTYRIGFMPPLKNSLSFGELFIEIGEGAPRMWIGTRKDGKNPGDIVVLSGAAGEARDPPAPAEPADALPTPQQHLPAQYQNEAPPPPPPEEADVSTGEEPAEEEPEPPSRRRR